MCPVSCSLLTDRQTNTQTHTNRQTHENGRDIPFRVFGVPRLSPSSRSGPYLERYLYTWSQKWRHSERPMMKDYNIMLFRRTLVHKKMHFFQEYSSPRWYLLISFSDFGFLIWGKRKRTTDHHLIILNTYLCLEELRGKWGAGTPGTQILENTCSLNVVMMVDVLGPHVVNTRSW